MKGTIVQVSVSPGGVPKLPVPEATVGRRGIQGDRHHDTEHHGGPERALCLWAIERIEALQAEGHPIAAGSAGENVTIRGIDWDAVSPGSRLRLGQDVYVEVTRYTTPCKKNQQWFAGGNFNRMHQELHPGWSRVYARVLADGVIRPGDPAELLGVPPLPEKPYERKISAEEAESGYILVTKARLGFFPPEGEPFALDQGGVPWPARVESYACECRGPEKPHRHWFIRVGGFARGAHVRMARRRWTTRVFDLTIE